MWNIDVIKPDRISEKHMEDGCLGEFFRHIVNLGQTKTLLYQALRFWYCYCRIT